LITPRSSRKAWSSPWKPTGRGSDGWSAARIEEELVVTADGCEVITKFPAEELLIAGQRYFTASGPLPTTREAQSHLNTRPAAASANGHPTVGLPDGIR
jgi:hypothetical protein